MREVPAPTPHELIDAYLDGESTPEQCARLTEWLSAEFGHIKTFVRMAHTHRSLRDEFRADKSLKELEPARISGPTELLDAKAPMRRAIWPWLAAASVVIACIAVYQHFDANQNGDHGVDLGKYAAAATLERFTGKVAVINEFSDFKSPAKNNVLLTVSDGIECEDNATVTIRYHDGSTLLLASNKTLARLWMRYPPDKKDKYEHTEGKRIMLEQGVLSAEVAKQSEATPMILATPHAQAKVIGTQFRLEVAQQVTRLDVHQGQIQFTRLSDKESLMIKTHEYSVVGDQDTGSVSGNFYKPFPRHR